MLGIRMEAVNARQVETALDGFASEVTDLTSIWPRMANDLYALTLRQFQTGGGAGEHGEWAPLEEEYRKRKLAKWGWKPIEEASGRLMASFDPGGGDHVDRRTATTLEWGTDTPYAIYQQTGYAKAFGGGRARATVGAELTKTTGGPAHPRSWARKAFTRGTEMTSRSVPARRLLDPSDGDIQELMQGVQKGIINMARRRGFAIAGEYPDSMWGGTSPSEAFQLGKSALSGTL